MDRSSFLRKALLGNAAFSALSGSALLFFPAAVSRFLGFSQPRELRDLGVSLLVFAALLTATATRRRLRAWAAGVFTAMDIAWVIATAALVVARPDLFNTAGVVTVIVVALAVADFAALQVIGIRRLTKEVPEREHELHRRSLESAGQA